MGKRGRGVASVMLLAMFAACGGKTEDTPVGSNSASGATGALGGSAGAGAGGGGTGGSIVIGGSAGAGGVGGAYPSCPARDFEPRALDMFVLLDRSAATPDFSGSWEALTRALATFVISPYAQARGPDVGVGLNYFGFHPQGPPLDPGLPGSCNLFDYMQPDVPIRVLPGGARLIVESLGRQTPGGARPTQPALSGAIKYVAEWASVNPLRKPIVVLATDGEPLGCTDNDVAAVEQVARAALSGSPSIRSYVVGSRNSAYLNAFARAGGTEAAFLAGQSDAGPLDDAFQRIHDAAIRCEFKPPAGEYDPDKVNLLYAPPNGEDAVLGFTGDVAGCLEYGGGWFYQRGPHNQPVAIELCPNTCEQIGADYSNVKIAIGCH
jgi:hypothetical protein